MKVKIAHLLDNEGNLDNGKIDRLVRGVIPVVNENDALSTEDIELDDNYYLVLRVAGLIQPRFIVVHTACPDQYMIIWGGRKGEYGMENETHIAVHIEMLKKSLPDGPVVFPSRLPEFNLV